MGGSAPDERFERAADVIDRLSPLGRAGHMDLATTQRYMHSSAVMSRHLHLPFFWFLAD
jgi:hypothetical protein